jgi:hypothetical protein
MSTRSIHFPPPREACRQEVAAKVNVLEAFSSALRDAETIRELLRGLILSNGRHGDLQSALSATRQLERSLVLLIEAEEV